MRKFLALLACGALLTGCSVPEATSVEVYYVGDTPSGFRLFVENAQISAGSNLEEKVLGDLISGQLQPIDPDYTNLWGVGNSLKSLSVEGDSATIDLAQPQLNVGAESEALAIEQLVWTLTELNPAITEVRILVNGEAVESLAGHVDATNPFVRGDATATLSAVQILSLKDGGRAASDLTITGEACTFEANVAWTLSRLGKIEKQGSTTAAQACPTRSTWSVELKGIEPGEYTFTVTELSAKDGSIVAKDDKRFVVE